MTKTSPQTTSSNMYKQNPSFDQNYQGISRPLCSYTYHPYFRAIKTERFTLCRLLWCLVLIWYLLSCFVFVTLEVTLWIVEGHIIQIFLSQYLNHIPVPKNSSNLPELRYVLYSLEPAIVLDTSCQRGANRKKGTSPFFSGMRMKGNPLFLFISFLSDCLLLQTGSCILDYLLQPWSQPYRHYSTDMSENRSICPSRNTKCCNLAGRTTQISTGEARGRENWTKRGDRLQGDCSSCCRVIH